MIGMVCSMYRNIAIAFCLAACGNNFGDVSNPPPNDLGAPDSGAEAGVHNPPSGLCCQLTGVEETDSALWYGKRYDCPADDAAVNAYNPGWVCNVNANGMCGGSTGIPCYSCDQTECVTGMSCLAINGTGLVIACDAQGDF